MKGSPHITYRSQKGSNPNDDGYTAHDSKCTRKEFEGYMCLDCPMSAMGLDCNGKPMPRVKCVITGTY